MWKKLISIATFLSIVVGIIVQWPEVEKILGLDHKTRPEQNNGNSTTPGNGTLPPLPPPPEATCKPSFTIGFTPIITRFTDADVVGKDSEVDSDDWTSVDLSYDVKTSNRDVKLELKWAVQERNSNRTRGNTRIESKKTVTLFDLDNEQGCLEYRISGTNIKTPAGDHEEYYQGEARGQQRFPDTGYLKGIKLEFDKKGGDDNAVQKLDARFSGFKVSTQKK